MLDRSSFKALGFVILFICISLAQTAPGAGGYAQAAPSAKYAKATPGAGGYAQAAPGAEYAQAAPGAGRYVQADPGTRYEPMAWNKDLARMQYQNSYDGPLSVSCYGIQGMYKVTSVHSNYHEDRIWMWECRNVVNSGSLDSCSKTDYVNEFDLPMNFLCPANKYIAGVESHHDNGVEDRRWKFTCCGISGKITTSCRQTGYVNNFDTPINFEASNGEVITGVYSYHDNGAE